MDQTLIIWRRFGKEHGENSGFRVNPPETVQQHLQNKAVSFRTTPEADWRWWQVDEHLLLEITPGSPQTYFYLPEQRWVLVHYPEGLSIGPEWSWYIHIGDISYDERFACWVFTDLFADAIVQEDGRTHSMLDLDDVGTAYTLGLITADMMVSILTDTQRLIDEIRAGNFPPIAVRDALPKCEA